MWIWEVAWRLEAASCDWFGESRVERENEALLTELPAALTVGRAWEMRHGEHGSLSLLFSFFKG